MNPANDQQILREILLREIETIHRYQEMLARAGSGNLQRFLAHAIFEEKEHVAEALQILRELDPMQEKALQKDHSEHFRAGGSGDRALAWLRGQADGIGDAPESSGGAGGEPGAAGEPHRGGAYGFTVGSLRER